MREVDGVASRAVATAGGRSDQTFTSYVGFRGGAAEAVPQRRGRRRRRRCGVPARVRPGPGSSEEGLHRSLSEGGGLGHRRARGTRAAGEQRIHARALKLRLRERLHARKFEMDVVERSYWQLLSDSKLHAHTESAVKRRVPTIDKLAEEYNKLCTEIAKIIKNGGAPRGSITPVTIPPKGLWQLNVDDAIFQDVGLDDRYGDNGDNNPPLWLSDDNVRKGINAVLQLDRCDEEERRLQRENSALRVWFRQEWEIVTKAIEGAVSDVDKYHLQLHQDRLVKLAATWDK
ncbi:hypothetical protein K438DRAFT_2097945, partial [Mycena galopus ATCC 62051]